MTKKVVVVDDDPVVRLLMSEILTPHGYEVHAVDNGADGLRWIKDHPADGVFVDFIMPDMTGLELLRQIRAVPNLEKLPVILLSADKNLGQDDAQIKPDRILEKSWDVKALLKTVDEITAGSQ